MGRQDRRYIIIEAMGDLPESAGSDAPEAAPPPPSPLPPPPPLMGSAPPVPSFKRFGVGAAAAPAGEARPVMLDIQEHSLSEAQAAEARQSAPPDRPRLVLESMPMRLIRPASTATSANGCVGDSWGIAATGADVSALTGAGVRVAVLDTGIDLAHPAFAAITSRIEVRDFTSATGSGHDVDGHGTHCAGTIFGQDVGGRRIGLARGVEKALIAKVLADSGPSDTKWLFDAINWAAQEQAQVISMSLGFDYPGMVRRLIEDYDFAPDAAASEALVAFAQNLRAFDALIEFLEAQAPFGRDALVVAASGNESRHADSQPAAISAGLPSASQGVEAIGALERFGAEFRLAAFSNINVDLCAPGVDICSAKANSTDVVAMSGTSMACPHVAGVAVLWWEQMRSSNPQVSAREVRERLYAAAVVDGLPQPHNPTEFGRGRVMAP